MEETCIQEFGKKTHGKGPVKELDAESKNTLTPI
jgi:hypothetical protein